MLSKPKTKKILMVISLAAAVLLVAVFNWSKQHQAVEIAQADVTAAAVITWDGGGTDGNIFTIMGKVRKVLKAAGLRAEAKEYTDRVVSCRDYDEALRITMDYVEVI